MIESISHWRQACRKLLKYIFTFQSKELNASGNSFSSSDLATVSLAHNTCPIIAEEKGLSLSLSSHIRY